MTLLNDIDEYYDKICKQCGHTRVEHYENSRNYTCGIHHQFGPHGKIIQCDCPGFGEI